MHAIDTHCHLTLSPKKEQEAQIRRAHNANVLKMITVACTLPQTKDCLELAKKHEWIFATAGIHPTDLTDNLEGDLKQVYDLAKAEKKIVAIGEIGLDYYHDKFPHGLQIDFLATQLQIAKRLGKPAILHCRAGKNPEENDAAFDDLYTILQDERFKNAVMHCFSGNQHQADDALDLGLMMSFTGNITYDRNTKLREVIKTIPIQRIMIETDSPFLTPKAHGEKPNEPAYVVEVAKTIAEVKELSLDQVLTETSKNAERFFNI
jgi:TatD DNase family protein